MRLGNLPVTYKVFLTGLRIKLTETDEQEQIKSDYVYEEST